MCDRQMYADKREHINRILPDIPMIKARWNRRSSAIPCWLEVPMSDGSVERYYPDSVHPGFVRSIELIRKMKTIVALNEDSKGNERYEGGQNE